MNEDSKMARKSAPLDDCEGLLLFASWRYPVVPEQ